MAKNFEDVLQGNEIEERSNNSAYPKLTNYIRCLDQKLDATNEDLFNHIKDNLHQIFLPDRELRTPLHGLFSKKKFQVLTKIKDYLSSNPTALQNCISETDSQFKYIYKYHNKFEKKVFKRTYADFDYLFVDVDFFDLDEATENTMEYFSDKLRNIAEKIITDFELKL